MPDRNGVRSQVKQGAGDLLREPHPARRHDIGGMFPASARENFVNPRGIDGAGTDAVDIDIIRRHLQGESLGESDYPALDRGKTTGLSPPTPR